LRNKELLAGGKRDTVIIHGIPTAVSFYIGSNSLPRWLLLQIFIHWGKIGVWFLRRRYLVGFCFLQSIIIRCTFYSCQGFWVWRIFCFIACWLFSKQR